MGKNVQAKNLNFSGSKEHFLNVEVRCDWSTRKSRLVSADARGGGTRDESLRESAGEANG